MAYFVYEFPYISIIELLIFYLAWSFHINDECEVKKFLAYKLSYVLFSKNFRTSSPRGSILSSPERTARGGGGKEGSRLNRSFTAKGR